jgi:hypothetical protein
MLRSLSGEARGSQIVRRVSVGLVVTLVAFGVRYSRAQDKSPDAPKESRDKKPPEDKNSKEPSWKPLFDGKSLDGWKASGYAGEGSVSVEDGSIFLGMGSPLTGVTYQQEFPKCDYEIRFEARKLQGVDFFAALTFPVEDAFCSFVVGGWGGGVVGLSSLDHADASENGTTRYMSFKKEQWYRLRVEVRRQRIQAWIDDERVVDVDITNRKLTTRIEVRRCQPLGIASYETKAELRNIEYRPLPPDRERPTEKAPRTEGK